MIISVKTLVFCENVMPMFTYILLVFSQLAYECFLCNLYKDDRRFSWPSVLQVLVICGTSY